MNFIKVYSFFRVHAHISYSNYPVKMVFNFISSLQMKEEELLCAHHIGDVISILQKTTHHLFDPDELLTVTFYQIFVIVVDPLLAKATKTS